MDISNQFQFYVGTVRGALASTQCKAGEPATFDLQNIGNSNEITSMKWGRSTDEVVIGYKNDSTRLYDTLNGKYTHTINDIEDGNGGGIIGAESINKNIIIGHRNGHINIWQNKLIDSFNLNLDAGSTLQAVICNKSRENIIGTGGERNDFKLWDVEAKKCIFKAKSMGHDELNLPLPTSIRSICFFPHDEKLNACCTKEGYVLLYDERAQRRPVTKFIEPTASYTTLATAYRQRQCIVGTTRGYMQLLDLKSPSKCVKTFKSFAGSVTDIICHPLTPIVASVSLDRHFRIHNLETKELLHKEYMKQSLTKFVMRPIVKEEISEEVTDTVASVEVDEDYEKLFEGMERVVGDENKKRKTLMSDGNRRKKRIEEETTNKTAAIEDDEDCVTLFERTEMVNDGESDKVKRKTLKSDSKHQKKFGTEKVTDTAAVIAGDEEGERVFESLESVGGENKKRKMLKSNSKRRKKFVGEETTDKAAVIEDDEDRETQFEGTDMVNEGETNKFKRKMLKSNSKHQKKFGKEKITDTAAMIAGDEECEKLIENLEVVNDGETKKFKRKKLKSDEKRWKEVNS